MSQPKVGITSDPLQKAKRLPKGELACDCGNESEPGAEPSAQAWGWGAKRTEGARGGAPSPSCHFIDDGRNFFLLLTVLGILLCKEGSVLRRLRLKECHEARPAERSPVELHILSQHACSDSFNTAILIY
jgi:hypothetical protein